MDTTTSIYLNSTLDEGLKKIAKKIHLNTAKLEKKLTALGLTQLNTYFFDTLRIKVDANKIKAVAEKKEINFLYIDEETVGISINEMSDEVALLKILTVFEEVTLQKNITGKLLKESNFPKIRICKN